MITPLNAAAREIVRLRQHNEAITTDIEFLEIQKSDNLEIIAAYENIAEWEGEEPNGN